MTKKLEYLQVILLKNQSNDFSGTICWPKSEESLSEFISEEWMVSPTKCMNHFASRYWKYIEGAFDVKLNKSHRTTMLFSKEAQD